MRSSSGSAQGVLANYGDLFFKAHATPHQLYNVTIRNYGNMFAVQGTELGADIVVTSLGNYAIENYGFAEMALADAASAQSIQLNCVASSYACMLSNEDGATWHMGYGSVQIGAQLLLVENSFMYVTSAQVSLTFDSSLSVEGTLIFEDGSGSLISNCNTEECFKISATGFLEIESLDFSASKQKMPRLLLVCSFSFSLYIFLCYTHVVCARRFCYGR